jgi:hypothetical protein
VVTYPRHPFTKYLHQHSLVDTTYLCYIKTYCIAEVGRLGSNEGLQHLGVENCVVHGERKLSIEIRTVDG